MTEAVGLVAAAGKAATRAQSQNLGGVSEQREAGYNLLTVF